MGTPIIIAKNQWYHARYCTALTACQPSRTNCRRDRNRQNGNFESFGRKLFQHWCTRVPSRYAKGDVSSLAAGESNPKFDKRIKSLNIDSIPFKSSPVAFWDLFGEQGHPIRTTISEIGPLLLARILNLNDTQEGVLSAVFRIADDQSLLLIDLKDLKAMLSYVSEHAADFKVEYGNLSPASLGAIQRNLLALADQGGDKFLVSRH